MANGIGNFPIPKPNGQGDLKKQSIKVYKKLTGRVEPMKRRRVVSTSYMSFVSNGSIILTIPTSNLFKYYWVNYVFGLILYLIYQLGS